MRFARPFAGWVLGGFFLLSGALQGCSLLFVAKGKTGFAEVKGGEIPQAASLSKKMSRTDIIHYKIQPGDTLAFLAKIFYGKPDAQNRLARDNHVSPRSSLVPGHVLRIVNPVYFPDPGELNKKRELLKTKTPESEIKAGSAFSESDKGMEEKDIAIIPRPKVNRAFAPGERLVYEVKALSVVAGQASLEVGDCVMVNGRPCYPLTARAKAAFPFSAVYPVKDVQTSYFDTVDFLTWKFENNVSEGSYKARNQEAYDQINHELTHRHNDEKPENVNIPPFSQDLISCFYYFRLLPLEVGKKYAIPTSSGGKNYKLIIQVIRRERVTLPTGVFDCFFVKPFVKYETVFRNEEDIDLWVTADVRHIPVLIRSGIVIGSIEISLLQAALPERVGGIP